MDKVKALRLFEALEQRKVIGRDAEAPDAPPLGSRFAFGVRLQAGTEDEGKTRKWSVRVTALHDAANWRELFAIVAEVDEISEGSWLRTKIRVENSGIELT